MSLSRRSVETLIDLVEIKLSCVEVYDGDDAREVALLKHIRQELQALLTAPARKPTEAAKAAEQPRPQAEQAAP
jgi:hypothetical protein